MIFIEFKNQDKDLWDRFVLQNQAENFLQSFWWGEFQSKVGVSVFRFMVMRQEKILAVVSVLEYQVAGTLKYWYIPRGPIIDWSSGDYKDIFIFLLQNIQQVAKQNKVFFIRFDFSEVELSRNDLLDLGFKSVKNSVQPQSTLLLDLQSTSEDLLQKMKPKTRYNIRLAERKGVQIVNSAFSQENFGFFWDLMKETALRDGITTHSEDYYYKLLTELQTANLQTQLYVAFYNNTAVAANIVLFFNTYAVYLHGASGNQFRNVMSPYLLQWTQIRDAINKGCLLYDFWGITVNNQNPKWQGITRFKQGFGGRVVSYDGVYDYPINNLIYTTYTIGKLLKSQ